jgi:antitoxin component YwqK of YwqJK toxin-antitoxin module
MKATLFLFISLLGYTSPCLLAQNVDPDNPINGLKTEYYPNGKISRQYTVSDGVVNGLFKAFSEKGFLVSERNMVDGIPQGSYKTFYENGQVQSETNMEDGVPQGVSKEYYPDGTLKKDSYLTGDPGEYSGNSTYYYEDGKLKNRTVVSRGELESSITYDKTGRVIFEDYKDRNISYHYDEDGKKHTYINGVEQK